MIELLLFIASALMGSGVLFAHKRMLTYIGLAGVLFEAQVLLTSLIYRTLLQDQDRATVFLVAGIVLMTTWIAFYKQWTSPYKTPGSGKRDAFVGIALLLVIAGAYPIAKSNGYIGEDFVLRGFYNGDVVTFASLVQKSFDTSGLVTQNPFAANGPLEYPTLLHGAFADFFSLLGTGKDWLHYLHILVYAQIFITIPLFFLLWDVLWPAPANPAEQWFGMPSETYVYALQTFITLFTIGLSFDSFSYPQSHFFLMGIFLACVALFVKTATLSTKAQVLPGSTAFLFAILLLLSNTVTGTVAVACAGALTLVRVFDKKRSLYERGIFLAIGIALLFLLRSASDGRTAFNNPHFSVSSASEMLRSGLPAILILLASIFSLSRKQYIAIAAPVVTLLGFVTFLLSDRAIVTENASRFLYHSFLIGFPLLLPFFIQILYAIRRELFLTLRPSSEKIAGLLALLGIIGIIVLPIGISMGNTYLSLVKSEPTKIPLATRTAIWWIDEHADKNDVIIASPYEPYIVPLFTGRSLVRLNDYWLSPQDELMKDTVRAFAGDANVQNTILPLGKYLLLNKEQQVTWDTKNLKKVFEAPDAIVYETR